jgi:glc operon protein GlcG
MEAAAVPRGAAPSEAGNWPMRPTLPAELSRQLVDSAVLAATDLSMPVTVVIVDESGVLMELCRMDGAAPVSVEIAKGKASAAVATGMPPDEFYGAVDTDGATVAWFASRPGLALVAGGIPVIADGRVAGAIGVAGAMTAADDRRIAETAIQLALPEAGGR